MIILKEVIAEWKKSTDNKMIYSANVNRVEFKMYIPKWRIPDSIPNEILIKIYPPDEIIQNKRNFSRRDVEKDSFLKENVIHSEVYKVSVHTQTIRFDPKGNPLNWETGSPYIPKTLLREYDFEDLIIVIEWLN